MAKPLRKKLFYTSADLARICETDVKTIHMWAEKGRIVTFRTPGHHLRITHDVLMDFLKGYGYPIPAVLNGAIPGVEIPLHMAEKILGQARSSTRDPFHAPECDCLKCEIADRNDKAAGIAS